MQTKEYRTVDKSEWGPGPWTDEPDKKQWQDAVTGLPCLIVRNNGGALCGYVGVAEGHPLYGKHKFKQRLDVHGGITFTDFCAETDDESQFICHVPGPGEPAKVFWLGFDCAHSGDLMPKYVAMDRRSGYSRECGAMYREVPYVERECAMLAKQLSRIKRRAKVPQAAA